MRLVLMTVTALDLVHGLFDFYPDEISFGEVELSVLPKRKARALRHAKDVAYLRSD